MSASADRAKRRDIRRAMGPAVAQHVSSQSEAIMDLRGRHASMAQQFAQDSDALHSALLVHDAALVSFNDRLDLASEICACGSGLCRERDDALSARIDALEHPPTVWRRVLTWLRVGR